MHSNGKCWNCYSGIFYRQLNLLEQKNPLSALAMDWVPPSDAVSPETMRFYPNQPDTLRSRRDGLRFSSEYARNLPDTARFQSEFERTPILLSNLYARQGHRKKSRMNRIIA